MNKSMLAGIGIGVAAALGVAAVAGLNVLDRGPQYAQVVSSTPIKESVKTPRQECRNVTVTHRRPVQDENRIAGSVLGAVAGGVIGHQFGGGRGAFVPAPLPACRVWHRVWTTARGADRAVSAGGPRRARPAAVCPPPLPTRPKSLTIQANPRKGR